MKRSQINKIIDEAIVFTRNHSFYLPPFAYFSPGQWEGADISEISACRLGWDVTDFGSDDYNKRGLLMFTIRGGSDLDRKKYPKIYCEKLLIVGEGQITPYHYHTNMREDIINRGGGNLLISLCKSDANDGLSPEGLTVSIDGRPTALKAEETVSLRPGESVTIEPCIYHMFRGESGCGLVLGGEVSSIADLSGSVGVNNVFLEPVERFPRIDEDEPASHRLCGEYMSAASK